MIYGYSDNLDKNYVSPPLSLYPLCTVQYIMDIVIIVIVIMDIQWCSRNSKSHFARNFLANRRTNLTLIVRLGAKSDLLIEQLPIGEHYCSDIYIWI